MTNFIDCINNLENTDILWKSRLNKFMKKFTLAIIKNNYNNGSTLFTYKIVYITKDDAILNPDIQDKFIDTKIKNRDRIIDLLTNIGKHINLTCSQKVHIEQSYNYTYTENCPSYSIIYKLCIGNENNENDPELYFYRVYENDTDEYDIINKIIYHNNNLCDAISINNIIHKNWNKKYKRNFIRTSRIKNKKMKLIIDKK